MASPAAPAAAAQSPVASAASSASSRRASATSLGAELGQPVAGIVDAQVQRFEVAGPGDPVLRGEGLDRALRRLELGLQRAEPPGQPFGRLLGRAVLHLDLVLDVEPGMGVGDQRRFLRVGRRHRDVEQVALRLARHPQPRQHPVDQQVHLPPVERRRRSVSGSVSGSAPGAAARRRARVELRIGAEIERDHQLLDQPARAHHPELGVDRAQRARKPGHHPGQVQHVLVARLHRHHRARGVHRHRRHIGPVPAPADRQHARQQDPDLAPPQRLRQTQKVDLVRPGPVDHPTPELPAAQRRFPCHHLARSLFSALFRNPNNLSTDPHPNTSPPPRDPTQECNAQPEGVCPGESPDRWPETSTEPS